MNDARKILLDTIKIKKGNHLMTQVEYHHSTKAVHEHFISDCQPIHQN